MHWGRRRARDAASALAVFTVAGLAAANGWWHKADADFVAWVSRWPDGIESAAEIVLIGGTVTVLPAVLALAWLRFERLAVLLELAVAAVAARLLAVPLKDAFEVNRPRSSDGVTIREAASDFAFPSAHAAVAFAIASVWVVAARSENGRGRADAVIVCALAALVGVLRWYMGAHFVVDVVGGAALGVALGLVVTAAGARLRGGRVGR